MSDSLQLDSTRRASPSPSPIVTLLHCTAQHCTLHSNKCIFLSFGIMTLSHNGAATIRSRFHPNPFHSIPYRSVPFRSRHVRENAKYLYCRALYINIEV